MLEAERLTSHKLDHTSDMVEFNTQKAVSNTLQNTGLWNIPGKSSRFIPYKSRTKVCRGSKSITS